MAKGVPYKNNHRINENGEIEKKCSKHETYFPNENPWLLMNEDNFYINKKNISDGLHPSCKKCCIIKFQDWIEDNKDRKRGHYRTYSKTKNGKENHRQRNQKYRKGETYQKWQVDNKDKLMRYQENRQHKNHKITSKEWETCKNYFDYRCAYCELPIEEHYRIYAGKLQKIDLHKEHVDHDGENDLSNCVPSCIMCNDSKWKFTLDEWYNENNPNFTQLRYDKIVQWLTEDCYKIIK